MQGGKKLDPQFLTLNVMNLRLTQDLQSVRLKHPTLIYQNCAQRLKFLQIPSKQWGDNTTKAEAHKVQAGSY